jgi:hypothetical protein
MFAHIGRDDVFNSPVATETASNTYIGVVKPVSQWKDGKDTIYPAKGSHR